ncbi:MAG: hypothetical protein HN348_30810 [Proteobacteria bacterium]|nr:hypothetical protein [Pseudomonadota bacterium]
MHSRSVWVGYDHRGTSHGIPVTPDESMLWFIPLEFIITTDGSLVSDNSNDRVDNTW